VPVSPRQQITSTAFAFHAKVADSIAGGGDLTITPGAGTASNYGLGWYGTGRLFNGTTVDGPVLYGNAGGALGSNVSGTKNLALLWNAAGQVGIGATTSFAATNKLTLQGDDATTPAQQLVIRGNTDPTERLNIGYNTTLNQATLQSYSAALTVSNLLLNPSGGNVGIGSASAPLAKLSIGSPLTGNVSTLSSAFVTNAGALGTVMGSELLLGNLGFTTPVYSGSLAISGYRTAAGTGSSDTALVLGLNVDNSQRLNNSYLTLHSNGYIGIGTLTPSAKLDIAGGPLLMESGSILMKGGYEIANLDSALTLATGTAQPTIFENNNTETMRISAAGYLGIGTTTPGVPLTFASTHGDKISLSGQVGTGLGIGTQPGKVQIHGGIVSDDVVFGYGNSTVLTETMRIKGSGYVGIGTATPGVPLDVVGYANATLVDNKIGYDTTKVGSTYTLTNGQDGLGIDVMCTQGKGDWDGGINIVAKVGIRSQWAICSGAQFLAYSDRRIKRDFKPSLMANDLALIEKLKPTNYRMVDPEAGNDWKKGFIAQEVEKVIPQAVSLSSEFVPEIMAMATASHFDAAEKTLALTLPKDHALRVGDKVRLHLDGRRLDLTVSTVPGAREFVVRGCDKEPLKVLVYGKQVHDFRTVDYDRIFTTGIGAIQELDRQLKEKDARIAALEAKLATQAEVDASHNARLVALEKLLNKPSAAETVSVKLGGQ
ncbi:MAG: tail fiber domain-containing protein, partial [Verrucomicrobiota bacterium]